MVNLLTACGPLQSKNFIVLLLHVHVYKCSNATTVPAVTSCSAKQNFT